MQQMMVQVIAGVAIALVLGLSLGSLLTHAQIDPVVRDRVLPAAVQIGIMAQVIAGVAIALVLGLSLPAQSTESPKLPSDAEDSVELAQHSDAADTATPAAEVLNDAKAGSFSGETDDVPMYRGNPARTGEMPGPDPIGQIGELWRVEIGQEVWSSPAVVNGMVFIGTGGFEDRHAGAVLALDAATGEERWRFEAGSFASSPTVLADRVFIGSLDGNLYALNASDGRVIQRYALRGLTDCFTASSPIISGDTVLASFGCFGPEDTAETAPWTGLSGYLAAFNVTSGTEVWRFAAVGYDPGVSPAMSNGVVVFSDNRDAGHSTGATYALDAATGQELWRFEASTGFFSSPSIDEGLVFVVGWHGELFALDLSTGLARWRLNLGTESGPLPAVSGGVVYAGDWGGSFYAIDAATGEEIWRAPGYTSGAATILSEEHVYVVDFVGNVHVIDRETGSSEVIRADAGSTGGGLISSPAVSDGVIYLGKSDGAVVTLGDLRATMPIESNMVVVVRGETTALRAAPSTGAIVRAELAIETELHVTGEAEEREGQAWWPVEAEGVGPGWVPGSAIVVAEVAPTPTSTPRPTSTPVPPTNTPVPLTNTPVPPTSTPSPISTKADDPTPRNVQSEPEQTAESQAAANSGESVSAESKTAAELYLAHLYTDGCGNLGTPSERLADLVLWRSPARNLRPLPVGVATTLISEALPDIIGGGRAIGVTNPAEPSVLVACGEITGTPDEQGDLFNALSRVSGSSAAGVAWLHDNGDSTTTIVVFFAPGIAPSGVLDIGNERPVMVSFIAGGNCNAIGGLAERLADLVPSLSQGASAGLGGVSTTDIAVPLQELDGQLVVGYEEQDMESPVFCEIVAGEPDENGDLFLAVPAHGDSQALGFAWLHDNQDGTTTIVLLVA